MRINNVMLPPMLPNISDFGFLKLQTFSIGLLLGCMSIADMAIAATLPKGDCADPKPYTDLTQCRFKKTDLRNKDIQGADISSVCSPEARMAMTKRVAHGKRSQLLNCRQLVT